MGDRIGLGILSAIGYGFGPHLDCVFSDRNSPSRLDGGAYKSNRRTSRTHTDQDEMAFLKRLAKRRGKKGYRVGRKGRKLNEMGRQAA